MKQELGQDFNTRFLNMSEAQAKSRHEDYDEKYESFKKMAMENPSIINTMTAQADPAEWAYQQAAGKLSMEEFGNDPVAYKEKLKAEILNELKTDKNSKIEKTIIEATKLPPSAADIIGKSNTNVGVAVSNDPLGDAFGDR